MKNLIFVIALLTSLIANGTEKGLLQQILITNEDEVLNLDKTVSAEVMITKAEEKAILKIKEIINKESNPTKNAENYFRLAELYSRRAKTYHFFEINKEEIKAKKINTENIESIIGFKTGNEKSKHQEALNLYKKIIQNYSKYEKIDSVIFNAALTEQKLNNLDGSIKYFDQLVKEHNESEYFNEALLLASEIEYGRQKFDKSLTKLNSIRADEKNPIFPYVIYKKAWNEYNLKNVDIALEHMKTLFIIGYKQQNKKYSLTKESLRDLSLFTYEAKQSGEIENYLKDFLNEKDLISSMKFIHKLYFDHSKYNHVFNLTDKFFSNLNSQDYLEALEISLKAYDVIDDAKNASLTMGRMIEICNTHSKLEYCNLSLVESTFDIIKKWWETRKSTKNHVHEMNELIMAIVKNDSFKKQEKELLQILAASLKEQNKFKEAKNFFGNYQSSNDLMTEIEVQKHLLAFSELDYESIAKKEDSKAEKNKLIEIYEKFLNNEKMKKSDIFESATDRLVELYFSTDRFKEAYRLIIEKSKRTKTLSASIQKIQQKLEIYFASESNDIESYKKLLTKLKSNKIANEEDIYFTQELLKMSLLQGQLTSASKYIAELTDLDKANAIKYKKMNADLSYINGDTVAAIEGYISILTEKFDEGIYKKIFNIDVKNISLRSKILNFASKSSNKDYLLESNLLVAEKYFNEKKYEEAFRFSKNILHSANDKNLKSKARYIQAKVLKSEFERQSLKSSSNKTVYLILVKNEKFEKAQKSLLESLALAINPNLKSEIIQTLIDNSAHFSTELNTTLSQLTTEEKNQIQTLQGILEKDRIGLTENAKKITAASTQSSESENEKKLAQFFKNGNGTRNIQTLVSKKETLPLGLLLASIESKSKGQIEKSLFLRKNLFDHLVNIQAIKGKSADSISEKDLNSLLVEYFENNLDMKSFDSEMKNILTHYFEISKSENFEG